MGVTNVMFVRAENLAFGPEAREKAIDAARAQLAEVIQNEFLEAASEVHLNAACPVRASATSRRLGTFRVDASTKQPHREIQMLFMAPRSKLRHEMGPFTKQAELQCRRSAVLSKRQFADVNRARRC